MPVSEEIWDCLDTINVTQVLYENPRPGSHSFTSYCIPLVEIFIEIQQAIRDCQTSYSTYVSNHYFRLKLKLDSFMNTMPADAFIFPSSKSLYINLNRPFGPDWTQIRLILTYHAVICRLNRMTLLHFFSQYNYDSNLELESNVAGPIPIFEFDKRICNYKLCYDEAMKSAETIAIIIDSLTRIPSPYSDPIPIFDLHFTALESVLVLAIIAHGSVYYTPSGITHDNTVKSCISFIEMCLKGVSLQGRVFAHVGMISKFISDILSRMKTQIFEQNVVEYCSNFTDMAEEIMRTTYQSNVTHIHRIPVDKLPLHPDSIEELSSYFGKSVSIT